jgi:hypothetical protein
LSAPYHHRDLRAFVTLARELGLAPVDARRSKHWRVLLRTPSGATLWATVPVSASDHRTMANLRSDLRKAAARADQLRITQAARAARARMAPPKLRAPLLTRRDGIAVHALAFMLAGTLGLFGAAMSATWLAFAGILAAGGFALRCSWLERQP